MFHRLFHGHWFKPHIVGYDRWGFDLSDGTCERCPGDCIRIEQGYNCRGRKCLGRVDH